MILGLEYSGTYSDPLVGERENFINNYQATLYVNNSLSVDNTKKFLLKLIESILRTYTDYFLK